MKRRHVQFFTLVTTPVVAARGKVRAFVKGSHWLIRGAQLHLPEVSLFMPTRGAYRCDGYCGVENAKILKIVKRCESNVMHIHSVLGA